MLLSVGCAVGPDYRRPEATAVPETYFGDLHEWKFATPRAHLPRGNWWEIFGDAELNRLQAEALEANQSLMKVAVARFGQARSALNVAEAAQFPHFGVSAQPLYQHDSKHRPIGGRPNQSYDVTSIPLDFSYEIDLWGRVKRSVEAATAQAEASADDVESGRLSMAAELAANWIQLRSLDAEKAIVQASIDVYRKSLELVQNRRSLGMVSDLDLAQAQTVLNSAQAQLTDLAVQRAKYQNAIALLCGKTASLFHLPERPLPITSMTVPTGLPSELLERRPDIAAAEQRMAAANASVGVATAAPYPSIKFSGIAGFQSSDLYQLFDWASRYWAVAPSLSWPVFQGDQLEAARRQSMAAYEETVARYRQTVLGAFSDVETNLAAQNQLAEEIEQVSQALALARKQLEVATYRYQLGLSTYLEVATAQNAALNIERSLMRLKRQPWLAVTALVKSLGGGWERDSGQTAQANTIDSR
ncbi:efflux transporter outer membrane subunit [Desulfosoma sp.]|uniref:efflux transporter outer membrane subunit n=1 Tax=Desulfosoma sp. TaxID=2603217 RepID=UPI004049A251